MATLIVETPSSSSSSSMLVSERGGRIVNIWPAEDIEKGTGDDGRAFAPPVGPRSMSMSQSSPSSSSMSLSVTTVIGCPSGRSKSASGHSS